MLAQFKHQSIKSSLDQDVEQAPGEEEMDKSEFYTIKWKTNILKDPNDDKEEEYDYLSEAIKDSRS